jgi:hypothetical protein
MPNSKVWVGWEPRLYSPVVDVRNSSFVPVAWDNFKSALPMLGYHVAVEVVDFPLANVDQAITWADRRASSAEEFTFVGVSPHFSLPLDYLAHLLPLDANSALLVSVFGQNILGVKSTITTSPPFRLALLGKAQYARVEGVVTVGVALNQVVDDYGKPLKVGPTYDMSMGSPVFTGMGAYGQSYTGASVQLPGTVPGVSAQGVRRRLCGSRVVGA